MILREEEHSLDEEQLHNDLIDALLSEISKDIYSLIPLLTGNLNIIDKDSFGKIKSDSL